jgi:hypothetical protein
MKTEKIKMAEISRASYKTVQQVASGLDEARILLMNVSNLIQRQTHNCEAFRVQIHQVWSWSTKYLKLSHNLNLQFMYLKIFF